MLFTENDKVSTQRDKNKCNDVTISFTSPPETLLIGKKFYSFRYPTLECQQDRERRAGANG